MKYVTILDLARERTNEVRYQLDLAREGASEAHCRLDLAREEASETHLRRGTTVRDRTATLKIFYRCYTKKSGWGGGRRGGGREQGALF